MSKKSEEKIIKTWSRTSIIVPNIIGCIVSVHNGREYFMVIITNRMVGHKLGEFALTRTFHQQTKSKKKKIRRSYLISLMGKKVHPIGIRLGITRRSYSRWYTNSTNYKFFVKEDQHIRNYIFQICMVSEIQIDRQRESVRLHLYATNLRSLVGRNGKSLKNLRYRIIGECQSTRKFNPIVTEKSGIQIFASQLIRIEINSEVLADFIVIGLEKRTSFRRTIRVRQEHIKNTRHVYGLRIQISGRLNGIQITRTEWVRIGNISLHILSAEMDYSHKTANTTYGTLGIKVWIFYPTR